MESPKKNLFNQFCFCKTGSTNNTNVRYKKFRLDSRYQFCFLQNWKHGQYSRSVLYVQLKLTLPVLPLQNWKHGRYPRSVLYVQQSVLVLPVRVVDYTLPFIFCSFILFLWSCPATPEIKDKRTRTKSRN